MRLPPYKTAIVGLRPTIAIGLGLAISTPNLLRRVGASPTVAISYPCTSQTVPPTDMHPMHQPNGATHRYAPTTHRYAPICRTSLAIDRNRWGNYDDSIPESLLNSFPFFISLHAQRRSRSTHAGTASTCCIASRGVVHHQTSSGRNPENGRQASRRIQRSD